MPNNRCILLLGMTEQSIALRHFTRAGHRVTAAPGLSGAGGSLENPELDLVYLQPSDEARAIEELRQTVPTWLSYWYAPSLRFI
jgi:hypothetical protein